MEAKTGDRVVVDGDQVGQPERHGEVLEVIEGATMIRYRVRWDDGHQSVFSPAAGTMRVADERSK